DGGAAAGGECRGAQAADGRLASAVRRTRLARCRHLHPERKYRLFRRSRAARGGGRARGGDPARLRLRCPGDRPRRQPMGGLSAGQSLSGRAGQSRRDAARQGAAAGRRHRRDPGARAKWRARPRGGRCDLDSLSRRSGDLEALARVDRPGGGIAGHRAQPAHHRRAPGDAGMLRTVALIPRRYWAVALVLVALAAAAELAMGRVPICACGEVKLFVATATGPDNSQHIADWYSPSHLIHGFLFYLVGWIVLRWRPPGERLILATAIEA